MVHSDILAVMRLLRVINLFGPSQFACSQSYPQMVLGHSIISHLLSHSFLLAQYGFSHSAQDHKENRSWEDWFG